MQVTLCSDAWHANLQRYVFGSLVIRSSLCSYFWITVFCVIVSPVARFGKLCAHVLDSIADAVDRRDESKIAKKAMSLSMTGAFNLCRLMDLYHSQYSSVHVTPDLLVAASMVTATNAFVYRDLIIRWKALTPNWEKLFVLHADELEHGWQLFMAVERRKLALAKERESNKRRRMLVLAAGTRIVMTALFSLMVAAFVCAVMYIIVQLIMFLSTVPWMMIVIEMLYVSGIGVLICGVALLASLVIKKKCQEKPHERSPSLMLAYISALKDRYCPIINWVDTKDI